MVIVKEVELVLAVRLPATHLVLNDGGSNLFESVFVVTHDSCRDHRPIEVVTIETDPRITSISQHLFQLGRMPTLIVPERKALTGLNDLGTDQKNGLS